MLSSVGQKPLLLQLEPKPKVIKRVWRYQRGNQNPYIEEEQTTQWPKLQKNKQRYTIHTHKAKDRYF
jgi:hypothetical protein